VTLRTQRESRHEAGHSSLPAAPGHTPTRVGTRRPTTRFQRIAESGAQGARFVPTSCQAVKKDA
jgi:hypothetical protein